jgi:hypothetical protein
MDKWLRDVLWQQFGAAIDMLENAVRACPAELWGDRSRQPEFWYMVYHALFFLDLDLSGTVEGFAPPVPFTLDELDPRGLMPERVYEKEELLNYLEHGRRKCMAALEALTEERAREECAFFWRKKMSYAEVLLNSMRHVQHHTAQLNLILRQQTDSAPAWVTSTKNRFQVQ